LIQGDNKGPDSSLTLGIGISRGSIDTVFPFRPWIKKPEALQIWICWLQGCSRKNL